MNLSYINGYIPMKNINGYIPMVISNGWSISIMVGYIPYHIYRIIPLLSIKYHLCNVIHYGWFPMKNLQY
jgi:hypothetical protein